MRLPTLASLTQGLRLTLLRFPVPTVFALVTTGLLLLSIQEDVGEDSLLFRYAFLSGLGFVASLLLCLAAEVRQAPGKMRMLGDVILLFLLLLYSNFIMPDRLDQARPPFWYSYSILLFALHLAVALVPALAPDGSSRIWRFNLGCFLRFFFSSINAALLFGGLALALLSVDKLFELGVDEKPYLQLWMICAFFAHPMLFLGGLPRLQLSEEAHEFPKPLRFSLAFVGLPLVGLYLCILYAYVAKIALQWNWPNGWVAMPIFILGVISLLTFVLSLPLSRSEGWARLYHQWLFRLLLPLSLVLFMALQVRLSDYGMTINRYLGLALALWLFGLSLAYILRPSLKVGWMPFSLLLLSLLSIYGGPLGAFGSSKQGQLERLRTLASDLHLIEEQILIPSDQPKDPIQVKEFQSTLRYLLENFGPAPLETELARFYQQRKNRNFEQRRGHYMTNQIMNYLKLSDDLENVPTYFYAKPSATPTHGHKWMVEYRFYHNRGSSPTNKYVIDGIELSILFDKDSDSLLIRANEVEIIQIDLQAWAGDVRAAVKAYGQNQPEPLIWQAGNKDWHFTFVCNNAQLKHGSDTFQSAQMLVFLTPPSLFNPEKAMDSVRSHGEIHYHLSHSSN